MLPTKGAFMFEKNVVITGSSKGFGKALAEEFLRNGSSVVINSHNASNVQRAYRELYRKYGDRCDYVVGDVANKYDSNRIAEYAKKNFGHVDIWINNAGTNYYKRGPILSMSEEETKTIVQTNLLGTIFGSQAALDVMEKDGMLINLEGSGCDPMTSVPGYAVYESTKLGIKHFTKCLQDDMSDTLFKIGTLSPGILLTDMLLNDASPEMIRAIKLFAANPEKVAKFVYEEIETVNSSRFNIRYLTVSRVVEMLLTNHFDKKI